MSIQREAVGNASISIHQSHRDSFPPQPFDLFEVEIADYESLPGAGVLYRYQSTSYLGLLTQVLNDSEVIVGDVGFDLYRSVVIELARNIAS